MLAERKAGKTEMVLIEQLNAISGYFFSKKNCLQAWGRARIFACLLRIRILNIQGCKLNELLGAVLWEAGREREVTKRAPRCCAVLWQAGRKVTKRELLGAVGDLWNRVVIAYEPVLASPAFTTYLIAYI
jgi:hypothetical protein